jgi:hypothetical protein
MVQQTKSARDERFSDRRIIPLPVARGKSAVPHTATAAAVRRSHGIAFRLLGILLLAPAIIVLSPPILMGLLGIFVVWLAIVGTMAVTIVSYDLILMLTWRMRRPLHAVGQRAVPAGQ